MNIKNKLIFSTSLIVLVFVISFYFISGSISERNYKKLTDVFMTTIKNTSQESTVKSIDNIFQTIYKREKFYNNVLFCIIIFFTACCLFLISYFIDVYLIFPLKRLGRELGKVSSEGNTSRRIEMKVTDEIGMLAGEINYMLEVVENLFKEKYKNLETIYENELKFFQVVSQSPDGIIITGDDGRIVEWNRGEESLTGLKRNGIIGCFIWDIFMEIFPEENRYRPEIESFIKELKTGFEEKNPVFLNRTIEIEILRTDGNRKIVQIVLFEITAREGFLIGGISRDITEMKKMEEAVTRTNNYYIRLFDDFPNPIWRAGVDSKRDYFNKAWLSLTGKKLDEETGDGWISGICPEDQEKCISDYYKSFLARIPFVIQYRLKNSKNEYSNIIDHGKPLFDFNSNFMGYVGSCY